MTEQEAKEIIKNEPYTNVRKHLEAIQVAIKVLGEDCTMEQIWKWAEGNVEEKTARVKTCFACLECTAYVDIDGEEPRCWLDRDPLKCDRKMAP